MTDRFTLSTFEFFVRHTRTRFPFRYGHHEHDGCAASVRENDGDGGRKILVWSQRRRLAAKMVHQKSRDDFRGRPAGMLQAISHAAKLAERTTPGTFFDCLARVCIASISDWADGPTHRAAAGEPGCQSRRTSCVGRFVPCRWRTAASHGRGESARLAPGEFTPELGDAQPRDCCPPRPCLRCFVRHTVGLGDALSPADIAPGERVDDGPAAGFGKLDSRVDGLRYFKVKLFADAERDFARLRELSRLLERQTGGRIFRHVGRQRKLQGLRVVSVNSGRRRQVILACASCGGTSS